MTKLSRKSRSYKSSTKDQLERAIMWANPPDSKFVRSYLHSEKRIVFDVDVEF